MDAPYADGNSEDAIEQEAQCILEAYRGTRMFAPLPLHPKAWDRAAQLAIEHPTAQDVHGAWQAFRFAKRCGAPAQKLARLYVDFETKLIGWLEPE